MYPAPMELTRQRRRELERAAERHRSAQQLKASRARARNLEPVTELRRPRIRLRLRRAI